MNEVADRYRRVAARFTDVVQHVPADQWSAPSPCAGWTARDVVRHVVEVHEMMLRPLDGKLSPAPTANDDPVGAITSAVSDVQAVLDDDRLAGTEYDGYFGRTCVRDTIDRFMCLDLVVHGWDVATAVGMPHTIDAEEIVRIRNDTEQLGEPMRAPNVIGAPVTPPADADEQEKLLAFLGRDPRPAPGPPA